MTEIKLSNLENRILEQLEVELKITPGSARANPAVIKAFRQAITAAELTHAEKDTILSLQEGKTKGDLLGTLLATRIEEAIRQSVQALSETSETVDRKEQVKVAIWTQDAVPAETLMKPEDLEDADVKKIVLIDKALEQPQKPSRGDSNLAWDTIRGDSVPVQIEQSDLGTLSKKLSQLVVAATGDSGVLWGDETPEGELITGELLGGKYRILREIGKGGFSAVYEAEDEILGNKVAVKYLNARAAPTKKDHESLKEEARRVTKLNHPNIVDWKVFDEREDGSYYFVMELLEGEDLEKVMKEDGKLTPERTAQILLETVAALRAAHHLSSNESILHLDLKPKNVFIVQDKTTGDERVKVIDFGIGQYTGGSENDALPQSAPPIRDADHRLEPMLIPGGRISIGTMPTGGSNSTVEICTACTPEYASPEQCVHIRPRGSIPLALDGRSDLYSLGIMGYEMLTGRIPYDSPESYLDWLLIHQETPHRREKVGKGRVARELTRFLDKCLEKSRDDRWEDANEAYEVLQRIVHPPVLQQVLKVTVPLMILGFLLGYIFWPETSTLRYDLYKIDNEASTDGTPAEDTLISGSFLYFGPSTPRSTLQLIGLPQDLQIAELLLVEEPKDGAAPITGWTAENVASSDSFQVLLKASEQDKRFQKAVYLAALGEDGSTVFSNAFTLVYLDASSWDIASASIEGLGSRSIDPKDQDLRISIRGSDQDVTRVEVEVSGERRSAFPSSTKSEFRVPLTDFNLPEGTATFSIIATDQAGGIKTTEVPFTIVQRPLEIVTAQLNATRAKAQDLYYIYDSTRAKVELTLNHKADLSYKVISKEKTLREGKLSGASSYTIELPDLSKLGNHEAYVGTIELTGDENHLVLHADASRGIATTRIHFESSQDAPGVSAALLIANTRKDLLGNDAVFIQTSNPSLQITRQNNIPVEIEVRVTRAIDQRTKTLKAKRLTGPRASGESVALDLGLEGDGLYTVDMDLYRYDPDTKTRSGEPVSELRQEIIVDSKPPSLNFQDLPEKILIGSIVTEPITVLITATDETFQGSTPESAIALNWRLKSPAGSDPWPNPSWDTIKSIHPTLPVTFELVPPPQAGESPGDHDGDYELIVTGSDAAGNEATSTTIKFTVAQSGPGLEIIRPDIDVEWVPEDGRWPLRIRAKDRNGIASITGTVHRVSTPEKTLSLDLLRTAGRDDNGSIWEVDTVFSHDWSGEEVRIRMEALDQYGVKATPQDRSVQLPQILRHTPPLVEILFADSDVPITKMCFVPGNDGLHYSFGGQLDQVENALFRKTTLGPYNRSDLPKSWNIEYEAGSLPSFYIDEYEVSCAQYLSFLRSKNGYLNPLHWPTQKSGTRARHAELEKSLTATPNLPVTKVDWDEASAYANWAGKRLPSYVEWEYAFRGGVDYRPYPSFDPAETSREILINSGVTGTGHLWKGGHGGDVSKHGIHDLAGNAGEWTCTPTVFQVNGNMGGLSPPAYARSHKEELHNPTLFKDWKNCQRYWIVGGTYKTERFDFSIARQGARGQRRSDIGFRCAINMDTVLDNLESNGSSEIRFRSAKEK